MDQTGPGKKQRKRSKAERRRIVEETFRSGTSVAKVARAHGVNANQVFAWRKLYQEGRLAEEAGNALIPVQVSDSLIKVGVKEGPEKRRRRRRAAGIIDIDLGHARIRIEGAADPDCVRAAVEGLLR